MNKWTAYVRMHVIFYHHHYLRTAWPISTFPGRALYFEPEQFSTVSSVGTRYTVQSVNFTVVKYCAPWPGSLAPRKPGPVASGHGLPSSANLAELRPMSNGMQIQADKIMQAANALSQPRGANTRSIVNFLLIVAYSMTIFGLEIIYDVIN